MSACAMSRSHKLPLKFTHVNCKRPFELLYDLWTSPMLSTIDTKYFMLIVDDYTSYTYFFLKIKDEATVTFVNFMHMVERNFKTKIKSIILYQFLLVIFITHLLVPLHSSFCAYTTNSLFHNLFLELLSLILLLI